MPNLCEALGSQFMGSLPEARVNPAPAFSRVGIDYAGPFKLKPEGRSTKTFKGYVIVFVCMAVKAIHFEVVSNLTSDNFIAAFDAAFRPTCIPTTEHRSLERITSSQH